MATVLDDKLHHYMPFILERLDINSQRHTNKPRVSPLFIGINGPQGAGKTTLVSGLARTLSKSHALSTVILSIDDLYLSHSAQQYLASSHPKNPLIQHRGQPSTHDLSLGKRVLAALRSGLPIKLPSYDKSAFNGQGDRVPEEQWKSVNVEKEERTHVIIIEGWCLGFRALDRETLNQKWKDAVKKKEDVDYNGRLGYNLFENIEYINEALRGYDELTDHLDALVHIDAEDPQYVYKWRLEQEAALRASKGAGMTDSQVLDFVNGYYPSYELYTDQLRAGIFNEQGRQLRLVVDENREVKEVMRI